MFRKVIVTGANGGLGKVITQFLLNEGHSVFGILSPRSSNLNEIESSFRNNSLLQLKSLDLKNEQAVKDYIDSLDAIDAAVLSAGGFQMGKTEDTSEADLDDMININFKTAFFISKYLAIRFKTKTTGRIIYISSKPAIEKGGKHLTAYSVSKHMLHKLAEIMNEEFAGTNASASVIAPDMIATEANKQAMPNSDFNTFVDPMEIAYFIDMLLSEQSGKWREPVIKLYGSY